MRDLVAKLKRTLADSSNTLDENRAELLQAEHELELAEAELENTAADPSAYARADAVVTKQRTEATRLRALVRQRTQEADATTMELEEAEHAEAIDDAKARLLKAYRNRIEVSVTFAKALHTAHRTSREVTVVRDAVAKAERVLAALEPSDEDWPDVDVDEPEWPDVDADAFAAFVKNGPVQPSVTAARSGRESEKQDEQLITWAVRQALGFPRTSPEGREAVEAALSAIREDLQPAARERFEAELEKRRGKVPLGAGGQPVNG